MGRARLLGLSIAAGLGGRGLSLPETGRALRELGYLGGTTFAKLSLQPEFCSVLAEHGSPALRAQYFGPLLRGERLVANLLTEPVAGSDLSALATTARLDGGGYRLDGAKSEAAFAVDASAAIVYARVPARGRPPTGLTAFLVPLDGPGIERDTELDLGERWMRRGSVRFSDVALPRGARIGSEGRALDAVKEELTRERLLLAAIYLGVARSSFDEVVEHVGSRSTFGRPLARHQAVGFPLVEDWARLDAADLYVARALERADRAGADPAASALAKWLATEVALRTLDHAIQFSGGRGYSKALPHEQRWRDVRSGALAHGTAEIMHLVASHSLWPGRPPASAARRPAQGVRAPRGGASAR
jgi:cyclohexanecarboxyl-CoA dehydrogenase